MKTNTRTVFVLAFLLNLSLLIALLLTAVDVSSFSRAFYAKQYRELSTAKEIGITQTDLDLATEQLLDYIQNKTEHLDLAVILENVEGKPNVKMFNQREIDHMVDVRALYLEAMLVRNILLGFAAAILLSLIWRIHSETNPEICRTLRRSLGLALLIFLVLIAAIATYAALDFNAFWTRFHLLFFSNDLWILDPRTDRLIMMVPSAFFFALVQKILITSVAALLVYSGLVFTVTWSCEKMKKKALLKS